jgi:predicted Zn-dependent protease
MTRLLCTSLIAALALAGCSRVDGTNRERILFTSESEENQMGIQAYADVKKQEKICTDAETVAFVERVAKRVAAAAPDHGFKYEFVVLESETANAFCLPGGKVAVYTGILPYCANEAGLATVLGHEIGHAIARHGGERMSQGMVQQVGGVALSTVLQAKGIQPTTASLAMTAYGAGTQYLGVLPFSRAHESEADYLGLTYMAKAGYDPKESVTFWQRFSALGSSGPSWLSTHPASADRAKAMATEMPMAENLYAASGAKYGAGEQVPARWRTPAKPKK